MAFWLMKSEPSVYSIDDLKKDKSTCWEGVRNYQARNLMRDEMKKGDWVFFYHSNAEPPGIAGLAKVSKEAYPDNFAWNKKSKYFDARSTKDTPVWMMVDIAFKEKFKDIVSLEELKSQSKLKEMMVIKRGARLSVQPVSKAHFSLILKLAGSKQKV